MTARTRSANRSKPQRMSVASLESQIRTLCELSSACRLGSPIILRSPAHATMHADDAYRIPALPPGFAHLEPHLDRLTMDCIWQRRLRNRLDFHLYERRCLRLAQPLLPLIELPDPQIPFPAKHRRTLAALLLFGNYIAPLRPCFRSHPLTLLPVPRLHQDAVHRALTVQTSVKFSL